MDEDSELYLLIVAIMGPLIFSIFDFGYCLWKYGVISFDTSLSCRIFVYLIPLLVIGAIISKFFNRNESLNKIMSVLFVFCLAWAFDMVLALAFSSVAAVLIAIICLVLGTFQIVF